MKDTWENNIKKERWSNLFIKPLKEDVGKDLFNWINELSTTNNENLTKILNEAFWWVFATTDTKTFTVESAKEACKLIKERSLNLIQEYPDVLKDVNKLKQSITNIRNVAYRNVLDQTFNKQKDEREQRYNKAMSEIDQKYDNLKKEINQYYNNLKAEGDARAEELRQRIENGERFTLDQMALYIGLYRTKDPAIIDKIHKGIKLSPEEMYNALGPSQSYFG